MVIYNLVGQEIEVLERGKKEAGYYKVKWNASGLPRDVYFYRLNAGKFMATKKFFLLR